MQSQMSTSMVIQHKYDDCVRNRNMTFYDIYNLPLYGMYHKLDSLWIMKFRHALKTLIGYVYK